MDRSAEQEEPSTQGEAARSEPTATGVEAAGCLGSRGGGDGQAGGERRLCQGVERRSQGGCRGGMQRPPAASEPPNDWQMVHLYDDGNQSHWGTATFPFATSSGIGRMTERLPCEGVWLRWTAGSACLARGRQP